MIRKAKALNVLRWNNECDQGRPRVIPFRSIKATAFARIGARGGKAVAVAIAYGVRITHSRNSQYQLPTTTRRIVLDDLEFLGSMTLA